MQLEQLLDVLDYTQSPNYRNTSAQHDPTTEHIFRAAKKAGVQGTYVFHTSPPSDEILPVRPAVHIAEAKTSEEAREIHRKLWNLGKVPFLLVIIPNQIRVYTGFDYDQENKNKGLINTVDSNIITEIYTKLDYLFAESIDSGKIWQTQAKKLTLEKRVDVHLLNNLKKLGKRLEGEGIDLSVAHALIGKYVYIRYLWDRGIISKQWLKQNKINQHNVLGRNATLSELSKLIEVLEKRFNGDIFPLELHGEKAPKDKIVSLVASVFEGDDPISGQLHLNFKIYDFSYIPVETLSSIYEQFLHAQGKRSKAGAIYTPEPVADYLLCELNHTKPLEKGMKILDPCCGSGIFLVLAYRRLIEIELAKNPNKKLDPQELQKILLESFYGIERNVEACYITEFSLILTMLNYIELSDLHTNKDFHFPALHNNRIFECDFFDNNAEFFKSNLKFDWIVGNPPWIELKPNIKDEQLARSWIDSNLTERPATGNRVCEAFSWKVTELLNTEGYTGLLIHATSLFNYESEKYRKKFFQTHEVVRITNFNNLANVLFDGRAKAPAATLVYSKAKVGQEKPPIIHYGPFVINQVSNRLWQVNKKKSTWTITINENEIQTITPDEAETGKATVWKLALWGSYRDKRTMTRLRRLFSITLGELVEDKGWYLNQGLELRNVANIQSKQRDEFERNPDIEGLYRLDGKLMIKSKSHFYIPDHVLKQIPPEECYIRKGRRKTGLQVVDAPHIVLNRGYFVYSDRDFAIPQRTVGLSARKLDADYLRFLSIFLSSSISKYYLFFQSPSWGIERSVINLKDIKNIPVPDLSSEQIKQLSQLQRELASSEIAFQQESLSIREDENSKLQKKLDEELERILKIPQNISIIAKDFWLVRFNLNQSKASSSTAIPTEDELLNYGQCLANELDDFADSSSIHHKISIVYSNSIIVCTVEIIKTNISINVTVEKSNDQSSSISAEIHQKLKEEFSQWVYIQRGMRIIDGSKIHICKSPRLIDWTKTQALNDSDDIIAEVLSYRI